MWEIRQTHFNHKKYNEIRKKFLSVVNKTILVSFELQYLEKKIKQRKKLGIYIKIFLVHVPTKKHTYTQCMQCSIDTPKKNIQ